MRRADETSLLIFGLGYSGLAVARAARAAGWTVAGTVRAAVEGGEGTSLYPFAEAGPAIAGATHILSTVPPGDAGDPVLAAYEAAIRAAPRLRWIGYLSTTGVYGDRAGGWVDEATDPAPGSDRARNRLAAEAGWIAAGQGGCEWRCVDIFRLAGIYGPGRSAFDDLRAGRARRVIKPGHAFGRIHRDDIAGAVLAAMAQEQAAGPRILNLSDDEPAESADVVAEAARLLGVEPPPAVPFDAAWAGMSAMARSFWAENRKVASRRTQEMLGYRWRYPSYREGLAAILIEERGEDAP